MKPAPKALRCAIYTRVSSDHGLDQEFSSLNNQREAAEAYIKSQAHEGWRCQPERYDDGGFSGGSLDRPGLQRLLADVRDRRFDIRRLQGRPADEVAGELRQARRAVRPAWGVVCVRDAGVQHYDQHGAAGAKCIRSTERARLLSGIVRARGWLRRLVSGEATALLDIAEREGVTERSARMTLSLAFLPPVVIRAAIEGTLPRGQAVARLAQPDLVWRH